ncbi:UbiX family flavin prenyltransferase [bacterium]|jgi:flavin prenyltransferase|nr:UbiX family flavin prenyltransferase [bacterium]
MPAGRPIVVGITGASGAPYAKRLLEVLLAGGHETHVVMSPSATQVFQAELGISVAADKGTLEPLLGAAAKNLRLWNHLNLSAGIASGSFRTAGMVICPCSMSTLAAITHGQGTNLIHRAADVHLKERRKLILVPRETPLSLVAIENMASVTRAGAIVLPAMPGFYHQPTTIQDLVDFVVSRVCDLLEVDNSLIRRWGSSS